MSTRRTTSERIDAQKERMEQMQNEMKRLKRVQNKEERKRRDRRIYTRGGHMESILPDTIVLSDARFFTFLERTVANKFGRDVLDKLIAEQRRDDAANRADDDADAGDAIADTATVAATQGGKAPALKSAAPQMNVGDNDAVKPALSSATPDGVDDSKTGDGGATQGA